MTDDDRDLRRLLGELRETDAQDIPAFDSVLTRRRGRAHVRSRRGPVVAAAIAIAAALVLVVAPRLSREPARTEASVQVASWKSPTAFLLEPRRSLSLVDGQSIIGSVIPDISIHISQDKSP